MSKGYVNVESATRTRMLAVRRRDTDAEIRVRQALHALGYRFRLHRKDLPGTPDIVLPSRRTVILVHGCFWHGHPDCRRSKLPVNNAETWRVKIRTNKERDQRNVEALQALGWNVLIVWECETRDPSMSECLRERLSHS